MNSLSKRLISILAQMVPYIGDLLNAGFEEALTKFQENKIKKLVEVLLSEPNITSEIVNNVEFIMDFKKTLEAIIRLSSMDKVEYFANLLKHSYLEFDKKFDNSDYDEFLLSLSNLSFRQIKILSILL